MLLKLSKFCLYTSLFSVVIVMTSTFFPFIGGKYYFFRTSVELALIFFLLWWAFQAPPGEVKELLKKTYERPLFIAVSVFVLAYLLASFFAYNPHAAFWSNFERGEGGFQMIHYYLFFVLLLMTFRSSRDWQMAFILSLAAAIFMIAYGFFAQGLLLKNFIGPFSGYDPQKIPGTVWSRLKTERFHGSLGNPAYVAPYLIFSIFYALYLWFNRAWKNRWLQGVLYGALILSFLLFLTLSETRGAFLGLLVALLAFLIYLAASKKYRRVAVLILTSILILGSGLVYYRHTDFIKKVPGGRFFELFDVVFKQSPVNPANPGGDQGRSFKTRLWTWGSAWAGFKERPLVGWGPENFSVVFDKHFNPNHYIPNLNSETWFDRAHSVIFDYLAETGLLGLFSYLSIFIVFYWQFFKMKRGNSSPPLNKIGPHSNSQSRFLLDGLMLVLPLAYLVQAVALFDVLPIYLNLFLFLAFANFYFFTNKTSLIDEPKF